MRRPLVLSLLVAGLALSVESDAVADPPADLFQLAAGYAAKEACSCAFVEGRPDAFCTTYAVTPTGVGVTVAFDHSAGTVTTTFATASRVAQYTSGTGCVLQGL
jgi:hypothetical protein